MKNKSRVAVVFGGTSNEREVSLSTGSGMIENLDRKKYDIKAYDTKKDLKKLINDCLNKKIDVCLLALHGKGGEDGSIQGMLDLMGVPYTGSGVMSSAICINKKITKDILSNINIDIPQDFLVTKKRWQQNQKEIISKIKYPCIIKPNTAGSSVGITIAQNKTELMAGMKEALKYDHEALIEEYVSGLELSVPVLGEEVLPVIEIHPKNKFFDYEAKYTPGKSDDIVPARISQKQTKKVQQTALLIHQALCCSGITRTDFIMKGGKFYFLEINTTPGMTPTSLYPLSAKSAGITFSKLLDKIINLALNQK